MAALGLGGGAPASQVQAGSGAQGVQPMARTSGSRAVRCSCCTVASARSPRTSNRTGLCGPIGASTTGPWLNTKCWSSSEMIA
eukprot:2325946-Pyramimonas_sp.AAC.1